MKVFVTGASGFIGSEVIKNLTANGHEVIGLARSAESAQKVKDAGATPLMGGLEDLEILQDGVRKADGVIHTAFIHDFTQYAKSNEVEKNVVEAMGNALEGTAKPIVVTAGIMGLPKTNGFSTEDDAGTTAGRSSESKALELAARGINASVIRLAPSVHDKGDKGFIPFIINQARKNGASAFIADGRNHWPAIHRLDAAELFRLALEKGAKGALYNGIAENGIPIKTIAELIGEKLNLPVVSLSAEEAAKHFEWMTGFISLDGQATNLKTQEQLGWKPIHMGLLEDMQQNYF